MLPCILITPSTPVHEADFEIHYFPLPEKPRRKFLGSISNLFSFTQPTYRITLPDSPDAYPYGPTARGSGWSAAKRLRTFLFLFGMLFVALHLFVLPYGEFDMLRTKHYTSGDPHNPALVWEGWTEPPKAAASKYGDLELSLIDEDDLIPPGTAEDVQVTITSPATGPVATEL